MYCLDNLALQDSQAMVGRKTVVAFGHIIRVWGFRAKKVSASIIVCYL